MDIKCREKLLSPGCLTAPPHHLPPWSTSQCLHLGLCSHHFTRTDLCVLVLCESFYNQPHFVSLTIPFAFAQILPFVYFPCETFSLRPRCLCARSFYWRPDCLWLFPFINNDAVPSVRVASSFIFHVLLLLLLPSSPTWWFGFFPSSLPILIYRTL